MEQSFQSACIVSLSFMETAVCSLLCKLPAFVQVLTGDMLLAAAFVSYAGPFTSKFRAQLIKEWIKFLTDKGAPMTAGISDPLKVLVDDATVASWVREGLPSDPTSVQNGTILTNSERWPLMMDPQLQARSQHTLVYSVLANFVALEPCFGAYQTCNAQLIRIQPLHCLSKQAPECHLQLKRCIASCFCSFAMIYWPSTVHICLPDRVETCCRA